jgi:hypothetical protein
VQVAVLVAVTAAAIAAAFIAFTLIAGPPVTSGGGRRPDGEFIAIPTAPRAGGQGCRLALLDGTLILHPAWGVAVAGGNKPQLVFWPNGFSAQLTEDGANLLDREGRVAAHTGDEVRAAGGLARFGGREGFAVCPTELHFEPAQP